MGLPHLRTWQGCLLSRRVTNKPFGEEAGTKLLPLFLCAFRSGLYKVGTSPFFSAKNRVEIFCEQREREKYSAGLEPCAIDHSATFMIPSTLVASITSPLNLQLFTRNTVWSSFHSMFSSCGTQPVSIQSVVESLSMEAESSGSAGSEGAGLEASSVPGAGVLLAR